MGAGVKPFFLLCIPGPRQYRDMSAIQSRRILLQWLVTKYIVDLEFSGLPIRPYGFDEERFVALRHSGSDTVMFKLSVVEVIDDEFRSREPHRAVVVGSRPLFDLSLMA